MLGWTAFSEEAAEIAAAGQRLLSKNEVAFLATVSKSGRPRVHPFVPRIVDGRMVAFIMDSSPKIHDLRSNGYFAFHTMPGDEDEEFYIAGCVSAEITDGSFRDSASAAMGFATGVDEHHCLFEFLIDKALWTRWLDFGTSNHRPEYQSWQVSK